MFRRLVKGIGLLLLACLAALLLVILWPLQDGGLGAESKPIRDFELARQAAREAIAATGPEIKPECRPVLLDHGAPTRDVYVLLHGLSNCPAQYREFAKLLFDHGANVLIPLTPHHGFANRMTDELSRLTAQEMLASANRAVDIARGLGERVIVVGLSVNGVTAAWIAQQRDDVTLVVAIAPFLAPRGLPDPFLAPLTRFLLRAPDCFMWWDSRVKEALPGSPFSYPRFSTRSVAQTMRLGVDVFRLAQSEPPKTRKILLVTSPTDTAISLPRVEELAAFWKTEATHLRFPVAWNVPHDCIDPDQPGGNIALVYPQLIEWMDTALN